jgi:hypothetical protein
MGKPGASLARRSELAKAATRHGDVQGPPGKDPAYVSALKRSF